MGNHKSKSFAYKMSSNFHLDLTKGGNASKLKFLWDATTAQLQQNAELITATNLAIQQIKADKPTFALDYLREEKAKLREFRAKLNAWMQRNQVSRRTHDDLHLVLTCQREGVPVSREELAAAVRDFEQLYTELEGVANDFERDQKHLSELPPRSSISK